MRRGRWRKQVVMSQIRKSEEGVYFFYFKTAWRVGWDSGVINITERERDRRGLIFFSCVFHIRRYGVTSAETSIVGYLKQAKNSVSLERCRQEGNTNNVIILHLLLIID